MAYDFRVTWRGEAIGELRDAIPDMWYLEGRWVSSDGAAAQRFEALAGAFDTRSVLQDPTKGTRIVLQELGGDGAETHAAVITLQEGSLFIRRYAEPEAISWLLANVL